MKRLLLALPFVFALAGCESCNKPLANCCKVCTTGKACGDTCIPATETCHKAPGCACDQ